MIKLNVPYRSQWAGDAGKYVADCGPTCVAMTLNYRQIPLTPDLAYDFIPFYNQKPPADRNARRGVTNISELMGVAQAHQTPASYLRYNNAANALEGIRNNLDAGNPIIALVKYAPWRQIMRQTYTGGHFIVVTGYDDAHIIMHDPLLNPTTGAHFKMPRDLFCEGWGSFDEPAENWNWSGFAVGDQAEPAPATVTSAPTPAAAAPAQTMSDIDRRIRALAGYRQVVPPNLNNPDAAQLWRDRIGDWGLAYDYYVIKPGDTLAAISARTYGSQAHWRALHAYNNLPVSGAIYAGQTILIPQLGQSGAHLDTTLPSNTIGLGKAIDPNNMSNPNAEAFDYDAIVGALSMGIGPVDEE